MRGEANEYYSFQVWGHKGLDQGGGHRIKAGDGWVCLVVVPGTCTS